MQNEVLLLKCGELVLKGLNRVKFEDKLLSILRKRLRTVGEFSIYENQSTIYVEPICGAPIDEALEICRHIFGIVTICRAAACDKDLETIKQTAVEYLGDIMAETVTFHAQAKRADKKFPYTSPEISREVGGALIEKYPQLKVQMDNCQTTVYIEVRDKRAFVYAAREHGAGGMPTGSNGNAMLLLSGGIDSPVAGYMMAKRGLALEAIHFFSYPYTSEEAKQKTLDLAKIVAKFTGIIRVHVIPFTKIQEEIRKHCDEDYFTIIMRRFMMKISQEIAIKTRCGALVTGESLGQVASQTMEAITVTNAAVELPVFRPVIGMDKEEIVTISRKIGAFETSILPFEDCCTVFTPRHPQTKPRLAQVEELEAVLPINDLIAEAVAGDEIIVVKGVE